MRLGGWLGALLLATPAARADAAPFAAELSCQPEIESGRLVCRVDYRSTAAGRLVWADALVIEAPRHIRPLRSRVPAKLERDGAEARAALALAPSAGGGSGQLRVRARAVICRTGAARESGACRPGERELGAELVVP